MKEILITSSVLIVVLLILRLLFRRTVSRRVQYALWGLVLLRLLVPVSLPAVGFSVLTATEPVGQTVSNQLQDREVYVLPMNRSPISDYPMAYGMAPGMPVPTAEAFGYSVVSGDGVTVTKYAEKLTAAQVLTYLWYGGIGVMAVFFLITNLRFWRKLCKARRPYIVAGCGHLVYLVETGLPSPCLFGLFPPSIYLTPAATETSDSLRHVIAHESAHARHWDPLWSLLRCVCLTVYWFNPLVWAAAIVSKTDCELACDESALKALDEGERIPYGRTLLSLIPVAKGPGNPLLSATTMTAGKRQLKDRITRIAENRQTKAVALLAVAAIAAAVCAVTFTGGKAAEESRPLTGDELAYFNEKFFNGETFNIRNQFLSSLYESPAEIDLFALFYNGTGLEETMTEDEWTQVGFFDENGELVSDCIKNSAANLDVILTAYTGLTLAETRQVDLDAFTYLSDYDAYYSSHGDTNYRANILFTAGEREGDTIRLYCTDGYFGGPNVTTCVTLEAQADGSYWFVSHLYAEKPVIPTVYPQGEPTLTIPLAGLAAYETEPVSVTRHRDDCAERYGGFMADEDTTFRIYRSTDGNLYAAVEYETAAGTGRMIDWDVGCFFTFPADTNPDLIDGDFFEDLLGHSGTVIAYTGRISENQYNTINDYYYVENGAPVLLARAYGETAVIDLDGDGENELCASSGSTAQLFFQREGQVYEADVSTLLKNPWPEAEYLNFGTWNVSRRNLLLSANVPVPDAETGGLADRTLYFNGESLLVYRDSTTYTDHVSDAIDAPEDVLAAAKAFVLEQYQAEHEGYHLVDGVFVSAPVIYDDWRLQLLDGPFYETAGTLKIEIWRLGYMLHTATPDHAILPGSAYMTEDCWVSPGYFGCDYLYFTVNTNSGPTLLFTAMENDCAPGTTMFFKDMADRLLERELLTLADLDGQSLLEMLSIQPVDFFNRLAERPAEEQTVVLEKLRSYLASGDNYDAQQDYEAAARYIEAFGEDLSASGRTAWERLKAEAER